jgi:hypothetical protein
MMNGTQKKVSEIYLVDALSHAEAESRIIEEMKAYISGDWSVESVRKVNYAELFTSESSDYWWKIKVQFIVLDERTGKEKGVNALMLVQADTVEDAFDVFASGMKGSLADYVVVGINRTAIADVFVYGSH